MLLDGILEHNRGFIRGREPRPLPGPATLELAVVGCYDPRLDELLPAALGLGPERAFFLRAAGTVVRPDGDPLRSLALAVYMFGVRDILVVGHTSCRMAAFSSATFIEAFRARGVPREAFGGTDLRDWAGAIPDPRRGVQASVAAIRAAPFLPPDLTVAGLVLDDATGALEVIVAPGSGASSRAHAGAPEPAAASAAVIAEPAAASAGPAPARNVEAVIGVPSGSAAPGGPGASPPRVAALALPPELIREVEAIRSFVDALQRSAGWRDELARLRAEVARQPSAPARLALVEKFVRASTANARGVATAFDRLKAQTASARGALDVEQLVDLFRPAGGMRKP